MFFNAPKDCSSCSVGGEEFTVDENGQIEVPDSGDYIAMLAPHGFTPSAKFEANDDADETDEKPEFVKPKKAGKK